MDLEATVDEVLDAAVDLIEITSHETELLFFMRPREISSLMERKQAIAGFYTDILRKLERRRISFAELPHARQNEIYEIGEWVKLILGENARILRAAFEANDKLMTAIKTAAEEYYSPSIQNYSEMGSMVGRNRMDSSVTVTLGLDEVG